MDQARGIYVEIPIRAPFDRIWQLTQQPEAHGRWDLRFSRIEYLPRPDPAEPQLFLYETRLGFGLSIRGTGESRGERFLPDGTATSALIFRSDDPKSLIRAGSGYWRYLPGEGEVQFLTWYDYEVRFGAAGRWFDRVVFRPLIGWATAWSFDCLRLWAEIGQLPETSRVLAAIHAVARCAIAGIWLWHGLVPKLLAQQADEQRMMKEAGVPVATVPLAVRAAGVAEVAIAVAVIVSWRDRRAFVWNALAMSAALLAVAVRSPQYLRAAFNPVTLNGATVALSAAGYLAAGSSPFAGRCRRSPTKYASGHPA